MQDDLRLEDEDALYAALLARDPAHDGLAFVGVRSTGVFCRLTCPARKPRRENTVFFRTAADCLAAGFRACLRCQPLERVRRREPAVAVLLDRLEGDPSRRWREGDLVALGLDPSTVRRAFRRHLGTTFLELARLRRAGLAMATLAGGGSVMEAQQEAGYGSASGLREAIGRLVQETPRGLRGRALLGADWIETPLGVMLAVGDAARLHLLEFFDRRALPRELERVRRAARSGIEFGETGSIASIRAELDDYFAGRGARFETRLALPTKGFAPIVWETLRGLGPGETVSYGALAARVGRPQAVRAVARANGANRLAIVIPCHRVIGANGALTGYGGGLWRKRWLLAYERQWAGS